MWLSRSHTVQQRNTKPRPEEAMERGALKGELRRLPAPAARQGAGPNAVQQGDGNRATAGGREERRGGGAGAGDEAGHLRTRRGAGLRRQEQGAWCGDGRGAALRLRDLALSGIGRSRTQQWGDERAAGLGCSWRTAGVEAPGTWRGSPRRRRGGGEMARRRPHRSGEGGSMERRSG